MSPSSLVNPPTQSPTHDAQDIDALINACYAKTQRAFNTLIPTLPTLAWDFQENDHFLKKRGYAITWMYHATADEAAHAHWGLSDKFRTATRGRVLGILRHEMGHVIDFATKRADTPDLDAWALTHHALTLPPSAEKERRADAIAALIWGTRIYYDADEVQTTDGNARGAVYPRPLHLGL